MFSMRNWRSRCMIALILTAIAWLWPLPSAVGQPIPTAPPPIGVAFVIATNFETGSYSVIDLATQTTFNDLNFGGIHSDVVTRYDRITGRIYVVNRLGVDSVQVVDPQLGYTTPMGAELSVGNGTNPQDIVVVSPDKAYISRANSTSLLIINPITLTELSTVDLSGLTKATDLDGFPDAHLMLLHDGLLYVILQHFDQTNNFLPVGPGEVAIVDTVMDTVVGVVALQLPNPSSIQFSAALPRGPRILVGSTGDSFGIDNGGVEAIDPATGLADPALVVAEAALGGGTTTHFELLSATKGYAIVGLPNDDFTFDYDLVSFNPTTGERLETLAEAFAFTPNFAISNEGHLYLGPTDLTTLNHGVRIFDTALDVELTAAPLGVGELPPNRILMIEAAQFALTVHNMGGGSGTITSLPVGLSCGTVCTQRYPADTVVTLTATPAAGATFMGWSGDDCTGTGPCTIILDREKAVTAMFQ